MSREYLLKYCSIDIFQTFPRRRGLEHITGKQDLSQLPEALGSLLTNVQVAFNESFDRSCTPLAELGLRMVAHLDFLESPAENAHAFDHEGYNFIGVTIPLIERLRDSAERLVSSVKVLVLLGLSAGHVRRHNAAGGIFSIKLLFVATHEFGHHLLGHASDFRPEQWNDVDADGTGNLEEQAEENLADGYAVFLALGSLIDGPQGQLVLEMLGHSSRCRADAEVILLSALLLSAFSVFSGKSHEILDVKTIYKLTHPPAFARIYGIIQTARVWCQRYRPSLDAWLTQTRLEEIMHAEESSRPGSEGAWERQIEFFMSPDGARYFERLGETLSRMHAPAVSPLGNLSYALLRLAA